MPIPMLDLRAQYASIKAEVDAAVLNVLESQQFRGGPVLESFENGLAEFAGVRHAVGVGSGTDALYLALKALPLNPGDEVITSPFTFFATAGAIVNAGGIPVFADVEADTFMLDPERVACLITPRTRAIIAVHLFGQCAAMEDLRDICAQHGLALIEDAAQALGATRNGCAVGAWGVAAALSFYPTKNLGAAGEGGAILTNDDAMATSLRLLRCHGAAALYQHAIVGTNSHLHAIQAAVLEVKLKYLRQWNDARRARARHYTESLGGVPGVRTPAEASGNHHVYHQYVIRLPERDLARQLLTERGIGCGVFYPLPLHRQPCFIPYVQPGVACPNADAASAEVLALPMYPELSSENQNIVIQALIDHVKRL